MALTIECAYIYIGAVANSCETFTRQVNVCCQFTIKRSFTTINS